MMLHSEIIFFFILVKSMMCLLVKRQIIDKVGIHVSDMTSGNDRRMTKHATLSLE